MMFSFKYNHLKLTLICLLGCFPQTLKVGLHRNKCCDSTVFRINQNDNGLYSLRNQEQNNWKAGWHKNTFSVHTFLKTVFSEGFCPEGGVFSPNNCFYEPKTPLRCG